MRRRGRGGGRAGGGGRGGIVCTHLHTCLWGSSTNLGGGGCVGGSVSVVSESPPAKLSVTLLLLGPPTASVASCPASIPTSAADFSCQIKVFAEIIESIVSSGKSLEERIEWRWSVFSFTG